MDARIQESSAWVGKNRYGRPFKVLPAREQLRVLLDAYGDQHLRRKKAVGFQTLQARAYICFQFIQDVRHSGFAIRSLLNLDQRHVNAAVSLWLEKGLSASTLQTRFSVLRWMCNALGKAGMVHDPSFYGVPAEAVARNYVARSDKSWTSHSVIPAEKIEEARKIDPWVGAQLDLMRAFGLRIRESVMLRPHAAHQMGGLRIEEGTKGGRTRLVPILTEDQAKVLDAAKQLASTSARGSMCPPGKTVAQAIRRIYYVASKKLGINKEQLGITPHGLRHQYANDRYETVSGEPSTVRGGSILDRAADQEARLAVTAELGHGRLSITAAYTGKRLRGRPRINKNAKPASRNSPNK